MDINARNTSAIGKPALIFNTEYGLLSTTQKLLLNALKESPVVRFDRYAENVHVRMRDLSCLTAYTGREYSLFSRNDKQYLVIGTERGIHIAEELADKLVEQGYKWSGHTHVGNNKFCLMPSAADYATLGKFKQKRSVIYNSIGQYYVFEKEVEPC